MSEIKEQWSTAQMQHYWTPDGREIVTMPSWREYQKRDAKGNQHGGIRDANLDKGWLLAPPQKPMVGCPHCDKWHETKKEVVECGVAKAKLTRKWDKWAKRNNKQTDTGDLEAQIRELQALVGRLVNGHVLQHKTDDTETDTRDKET